MPPHADVLQWEHLPFPKSLREPPPDLNDIHALLATPCGCEFWLEDENSHEQSGKGAD